MMPLPTLIREINKLFKKAGVPPIPADIDDPKVFDAVFQHCVECVRQGGPVDKGFGKPPRKGFGPEGWEVQQLSAALPSRPVDGRPVDPFVRDGIRKSEWEAAAKVWGHDLPAGDVPSPAVELAARSKRTRQTGEPTPDELAAARQLWNFKSDQPQG